MKDITTLDIQELKGLVRKTNSGKVLILTSCTGKKIPHPGIELTEEDFSRGPEWIAEREAHAGTCPANQMYQGRQHVVLMKGLEQIRPDIEVEVKIVSAGYGLIDGNRPISPYEVTFGGRSAKQVRELGQRLGLPGDVRSLLETTDADLVVVLLGKNYLNACQLEGEVNVPAITVFVGLNESAPGFYGSSLCRVPLNNDIAREMRAGQVWLKSVVAISALTELSKEAR